jgi:translation elongation factor EF-Tu-like GTPase
MEKLSKDIWIIYRDEGGSETPFIAHRWTLFGDDLMATADVTRCRTLEEARRAVPADLTRFPRLLMQDPKVVEQWL